MAAPETNPTYQYLDSLFSDGTILGKTASSLVGMHGTVAAQASTIAQLVTTASTSTSSAFGYTTSTQAEAVTTAINSILTALKNKGIIAAA
jgi:hypothetical protein